MWAAVSLALYVAFWLELDNPYWAGLSAAIVCQPQLGASLRKGWFRMVGTMIGAVWIVVLIACFPQDRVWFLVSLAAYSAACAFGATVLRNFASYAAALAGITSAIITSDLLRPGLQGGVDANAAFLLAVAQRQRDVHRHRVRRHRSRGNGSRRRPAEARRAVRRSVGWNHRQLYLHADNRGVRIRRDADGSPRIHSPCYRTRSGDRPDARGIGAGRATRRFCRARWMGCSALSGWRAIANMQRMGTCMGCRELPADETRHEAAAGCRQPAQTCGRHRSRTPRRAGSATRLR